MQPYCRANVGGRRLALQHGMVESAYLDQICSLEFIQRLCDFTTSLQGTSIFDLSKDFYTLFYGIIDTYHF